LVLGEECLQSFTKDNFGRKLSDIELHRFSNEMWDNDEAFQALYDLMNAVVKIVTNEKDSDWSETDKLFLDRLSLEGKTECLEEHSELRSQK